MKPITTRRSWMIAMTMLLALATGCRDERVADVATQAADRQAQQNTEMAELHKEVASGTRSLVQADSQARQEIVGVHHELQAERARLDTGWDDLEHERQSIAHERRTQSLLAPLVEVGGGVALIVVLLGFCWHALAGLRTSDPVDAELNELLVHELASDSPLLLSTKLARPTVTGEPPRLSEPA